MGCALLFQNVWNYSGSNIVAHKKQATITESLKDSWETESDLSADVATASTNETAGPKANKKKNPPKPIQIPVPTETPPEEAEIEETSAFALVRIPRFGSDYEIPLVPGVDDEALSTGIGWDENTSRPGKLGNFVMAAHRVTNGEPFRDFPNLEAGDEVIVETKDFIYTYRLYDGGTDRIVHMAESWVTAPVPGEALDAKPTEKIITLVTCADLYSSDRRAVVSGTLVNTVKK